MSSSYNRFGRRTGRQNEEPRFEPQLSFGPKRPAARDPQPTPPPSRNPQQGLRVEREDAREFGISFDDDLERDDDFDPRTRREKALEQRVPEAERPLYHHLFDEQENSRRGFGWLAAFASVAVIAVGAGYAWNNFMSRPAPANLYERPGLTARGNTGYMTPQQPTSNTDIGANIVSPPETPAATPPAASPPAAHDQPPTKDIAAAPEPKIVPAEPPPPPKKTISEAAANPGNLGPPAMPASPPAPAAVKEQPAAAPAPTVTPPPPKRETVKAETPKRETPRKEASIAPPRPAPVEAPRKEASIAPRRPAPAPVPQEVAPEDVAPPVTEPAAAPAVSAPPRRIRPQATGQPPAFTRNAPDAAYAPPLPQQPVRQQVQPANLGPPPGAPDTVTVDGVNYVNGQEPRALGTLGGSPQVLSSDGGMPSFAPPTPLQPMAPPAYTPRPYMPTEHEGGAPLPNDVIILPNGQMALPGGRP
jgi:hypothetical protein